MKKITILAALALIGLWESPVQARQGFTIGLGPVGNIYLIDTVPVMDPGVGGSMFFQYRFHEQIAFETTFLMSVQDGDSNGTGPKDDTGILFLGMPVFDIKLYLFSGEPRWDPYLATGLGVYWLTEGRLGNSTGGVGLGAQIGTGFDYYLADFVSLGFQGVFRSVALITNLGTPSASTSVFPFSLMGNVAFHF